MSAPEITGQSQPAAFWTTSDGIDLRRTSPNPPITDSARPEGSAVQFAALMGDVATRLLGKPAEHHGGEMRWGSKGSLSIDLTKGTFFSHEESKGGGVLDLIQREHGCDKAGALAWLKAEGLLRDDMSAASIFYDYHDASGSVTYRVERRGRSFLQHGPDGRGGFVCRKDCMKGVERLLYRLPELLAADLTQLVFVTEGEKDADRLARLGLLATCNSGGAGKFGADLVHALANRRVVILQDNDEAGSNHAADVFDKVERVADSAAILALPDLPAKGDISDWLNAGGDVAELIRLAEAALSQPRQDRDTREIIENADPVDLWNQFDPPELPHGLLPQLIEKFARINAEHMGADPAALAMSALTVCAAAIPDAIKLKARRHSNYSERACIWSVLVGEPSTKKTPTMRLAKAPLDRLNFNLIAENNRKLLKWQNEGGNKSGEPKPQCPRLILEDANMEGAQEALKHSPNGMLLFQDELSAFFGRIEKYGGGGKAGSADRGFWLQSYGGGTYAVDRIGRGSFVIENLSVCLLGGIQFDPIRRVANESLDDGLIQRINPILLRRPTLGKDAPQPAINADYDALIEKLTQARPSSEFWLDAPITFDDEALAICREFEEFKMGLVDIERTNSKLATHLGKYEGLFVRYCLLFHCIENIDAPDGVPMVVQGELAERVRNFLFEYLMKHARAFYVELIGMAEGHDDLEKLAGYILTKRLDKVTARDLQRSTGGKAALTALEAHTLAERMESLGWLERAENNRVGAAQFIVNPRVHAKFGAKAKAEAERRKRARDIIASLASA